MLEIISLCKPYLQQVRARCYKTYLLPVSLKILVKSNDGGNEGIFTFKIN